MSQRFNDDRSDSERLTHTVLVVGTDSFLSGWGKAEGGNSYAAWACRPEHWERVESWVRARREMKRVRVIYPDRGSWRGKNAAHVHIYVVGDDHPALA